MSASERLSLGKKRRNSPFSTSQRVTASSMDHKNLCACSAALIASTCAAPIPLPLLGPSAARPAVLGATVTAEAGAGVAETETLATLRRGAISFAGAASSRFAVAMALAIVDGAAARDPPAALAEE